jgi:hypothetical protein
MPVNLDRLATKASESTEVTLDASMLQIASKFMNDEDDAEARQLISKLKGIYVRSFKFDKPDEYSQNDVADLRAQLKSPTWAKIVNVKTKHRGELSGENVEIYFKKDEQQPQQIGGLVIIAMQPTELTVVHIDGPINPEDIDKIGGNYGVPKIDAPVVAPTPKPEATPSPAPAPKAKPVKAGVQ